jgi:hypothetical protein
MMMRNVRTFALRLILMFAAILVPMIATAADPVVVDAGGPPMNCILFFDDWMLQARQGLDRVQGKPVLVSTVSPELPRHLSRLALADAATSLHFDERVGRYAMYVDCWTAAPERKRFSVRVESDDPRKWPDLLGERAAKALRLPGENVVVDESGKLLYRFVITPLAGTPLADRGYVGIFEQRIGFSPDGRKFEIVPMGPWIAHTDEPGFGVVYDPWRKRYIIFDRIYGVDRRVGRVFTTDFKSFSSPEIVLQPDAQDPIGREFYGMSPVRYEDMFIGCLWVFDTEPTEKRIIKMQGSIGTQLAYSYDAEHWYRTFRGRMLFAPQAGGMIYVGKPVRTHDDRLIFAAMGADEGHRDVGEEEVSSRKLHFYELRLDGFSYLKTRAQRGLIRTKALVPAGDELMLNVRTNRSGYVKVQVLDARTFDPIPHYTLDDAIPITGDHLFAKARWRKRNNLAELKGRPVVLEVHVREGELYALRIPHKAFYTGWLGHRL